MRGQDGKAIAGAKVSFGDPIREGPPHIGISDQNGQFEIATVGRRTVIVKADDAHDDVLLHDVAVAVDHMTSLDIVLPLRKPH